MHDNNLAHTTRDPGTEHPDWSEPAITDEPLTQQVDAVIERWVGAERIVGVVMLIARDGEVVYRRAAGFADREARVPTTEQTIFRLASMTKMIVSATAMALMEEGRLSLDDTVANWLPYFTPRLPDGSRPHLTIRHLMTHTSGLSYGCLEPEGNPYQRENIAQGLEQSGLTLEQSMRRLASVPLFYEPGTQWRYSLSTDVLGAVIERAARMPLQEAVARYVTAPLGMADTAFTVTDQSRLATAYRDGETRAVRMYDARDTVSLGLGVPVSPARAVDPEAYPSGGGGMSGTAEDYLGFLEVLRTGGSPILEAAGAAALATHTIGDLRAWTEGEGWGFSLGAAVLLDPQAAGTPQNPGTWQWGGVLGTHWFVDPAEKLTVVVLTNTAVAGVIGAFPAQLRDAIYGVEERGAG
jgi:CubicO group peptidase (beta-lactamase class C family)